MYAFLLLLGAVITAAGLGLVASGVSIQDHTFDATNVLPAMIAVIGGCILIGLSFVVRALQRVERRHADLVVNASEAQRKALFDLLRNTTGTDNNTLNTKNNPLNLAVSDLTNKLEVATRRVSTNYQETDRRINRRQGSSL